MRVLVVTVTPDEAELASDALWSLGVVAVEERAVGALVELRTSVGDADADVELPWPTRVEEVDERVAETWREHATPIEVEANLFVRPMWIAWEPPPGATVLHIEPGPVFGMGDHPTTLLSLRAVRHLVRPGVTVLDVGCGSGVLAIAAMVFGAGRATGIDIAPASVQITRANAGANDVDVDVSTTDVADIDGVYDIVVANILAPVLVALAPNLLRVLAPEGRLVVSGVLDGKYDHVLEALAPLRVERADVLDGWAAVTLSRGRAAP